MNLRLRKLAQIPQTTFDSLRSLVFPPDLSLFHQFAPPPSGGGHQFLRALLAEFHRQGLRTESNRISQSSRACLFNSFNFDFDRLRHSARQTVRMVHRVDGPVSAYRGSDDGSDQRIYQINRELAQATIFQSQYSLEMHKTLGLELVHPTVIMNTPDPSIFYPAEGQHRLGRKLRLVSTSWSDNPNKGAGIYQWLDQHLDWSRFEYTFIGRLPLPVRNIHVIPPTHSRSVASVLRQSDIFITASRNDPCSNSLLEGLSCGLPALYLDSGGHPEIVGSAGLPFQTPEQIPALLEQLAARYDHFRTQIRIPSLKDVALEYRKVLDI